MFVIPCRVIGRVIYVPKGNKTHTALMLANPPNIKVSKVILDSLYS